MNNAQIEPGLRQIFRLYMGVQLALLLLTLLSEADEPPPGGLYYALPGVIYSSFLLAYLFWRGGLVRLGRFYLPFALAVASCGPVVGRALAVVWRVQSGLTGEEALTNPGELTILLFMPLILVSAQYRFRSVILFCVGTAALQTILALWLTGAGGPGLTLPLRDEMTVRTFVYLIIGYVVVKLMRAQQAQRQALTQANAQLGRYAATLEELAVSRERNRMARELHDTLAHTLSAVAVQLEAQRVLLDTDLTAAKETLSLTQKLARGGLEEARRALQALRASPLEDLGLAQAARQLAETAAGQAHLQLTFEISDQPQLNKLKPEIEQNLYRIIEEAVTNVVRHANATNLRVALGWEQGCLKLVVADDGQGFDPGLVAPPGHYGLLGMRERAAICGGILDIQSQAQKGTTIQLLMGETV